MSNNEMTISLGPGKRVAANYGDFSIDTDQSAKNGGDASAPEPFDLFLASLGTCAGIYVLGFCQSRDLPTDGIELKQRWERNAEGKLSAIHLEIRVPPEFPEKYHAALVRSASKCAVKKVLENPPELSVQAVTA
jgi:ribosomal protein S12 methylthiotransferase accessory factor